MSFGHAHPVQQRDDEEVLVAFALVGAHARFGLALDKFTPQEDVFHLPLIVAFGLLAVAIAAQVSQNGIEVVPNGDETEAPRGKATPSPAVIHDAAPEFEGHPEISSIEADKDQVYAQRFRFELDRAECRSINLQPLHDGARLTGADNLHWQKPVRAALLDVGPEQRRCAFPCVLTIAEPLWHRALSPGQATPVTAARRKLSPHL
jgi:hypothetical protein